MNSKQKGKRGELAWKNFLIENGFEARRGQQYCGGSDSADVVCKGMEEFHAEVKCVENLNIYKAIDQALEDCGSNTPYVAHKKNRKDWLVTMCAVDWIELIKKINKSIDNQTKD
mgnify:CR=1 FL=1